MSKDRGETIVSTAPIEQLDDSPIGDDLKGLYIRDTKKHSRLEKEELARLSALVQQGIAANAQFENLSESSSQDDIELLLLSVEEGRKARNEIVVTNTGLVFKWASHYEGQGVDFLDLIQAGNLGLIRAAEKFDPSKGFTFSTYATTWIRSFINTEVHESSRTIRVQPEVSVQLQKLRRIKREYLTLTGKEMTIGQMAKEMGKSENKISELLGWERKTVSLNLGVGTHQEDEAELQDYIQEKRPEKMSLEEEAIEVVDRMAEVRWVHQLLAKSRLDDKSKRIVRMRFGIGYDGPMSYHSIKNNIGGRNKTIKEIFDKAMDQLKREAEFEIAASKRN